MGFIVIPFNSYCEQMIERNHEKIIYNLISSIFIFCKNIFVLVETTTNPEDIIKVLPLSKISDDCKNSLIKNRAPEKLFKFPPKIYKDSRKKFRETRRNCLHDLLDNFKFLSYSNQKADCFVLHVFYSPRQHTKGQELKVS